MLAAFCHTDNVRRFLEYQNLALRDEVCEKYPLRIASAEVCNLSAYRAAVCSRSTAYNLGNIFDLCTGEDMLLLGGIRLFRLSYPFMSRIYWLRSPVDQPGGALWTSFDLQEFHVESVRRYDVGILTVLQRRVDE